MPKQACFASLETSAVDLCGCEAAERRFGGRSRLLTRMIRVNPRRSATADDELLHSHPEPDVAHEYSSVPSHGDVVRPQELPVVRPEPTPRVENVAVEIEPVNAGSIPRQRVWAFRHVL